MAGRAALREEEEEEERPRSAPGELNKGRRGMAGAGTGSGPPA